MRSYRVVLFPILAVGILLVVDFSIAGALAGERPRPKPPRPGRIPQGLPVVGHLAMRHMPIVAPLFIQNSRFSSTVVLVNDSGISTYADLVLSSLEGREITTYRVQFAPLSRRVVQIRDLLASAATRETVGRVTVIQSPELTGMPIAAALSLTYRGTRAPSYIDEELAMPTAEGSQILRAVANDGQGSPLVAITSLSDSVQNILVECIYEQGKHFSKSMPLRANETLLTEACSDRAIHGGNLEAVGSPASDGSQGPIGISLTSNAMPGSFAAFGLARRRKRGDDYLSAINFADPKMLPSGTFVFPGVPVGPSSLLPEGNYVPQLSLANFSTTDAHVSVKFARTSETGANVQDLETILVPAGQTKAVKFPNLPGDSELRNSFLVGSDLQPGSIIARLASRNDLTLREVELLGQDEDQPTNAGNHPWSLEHGSDSTLLLFNHSTEEQTFSVSISTGDKTWQTFYELPPMQTEAISFRKLVQEGTKDDQGRTLPANAVSGQVLWFTAAPGLGKGRLLQSNAEAMARSFSCAANTSLCALNFLPNTTTFSVGSTVNFGSVQTFICDVTGEPLGTCGTGGNAQTCPTSKCTYGWGSNPNIASISGLSNTSSVSLNGVAPGTATVTGHVTDRQTSCQGTVSPTATVQVPTIFITTLAQQVATPPVCVQEGLTGYFIDVSYYVADQNSNRVSQSGMAPGENLGDGTGWHDSFATPPTTDSNGSFHDTPRGSCYGTPGHFCAAGHPQSFRITNKGTVFPIMTNTTSRQCTDGIQLQVIS